MQESFSTQHKTKQMKQVKENVWIALVILASACLHVLPIACIASIAITPHSDLTANALAYTIGLLTASTIGLVLLHTWAAKSSTTSSRRS